MTFWQRVRFAVHVVRHGEVPVSNMERVFNFLRDKLASDRLRELMSDDGYDHVHLADYGSPVRAEFFIEAAKQTPEEVRADIEAFLDQEK